MTDTPSFRSDVTVELVKHSASDTDVLWAARVSTAGEQSLEEVSKDPERSKGLINYLMRDRHGSPFEHNSMTFFVSAPIFVFREFHRHRVGWCLAGDTEVTLESEAGHLRRRKISDLYQQWHHGVQDRLPWSAGGVTWHAKAGKWMAQVGHQGAQHYLGLYENREAAQSAVLEFREQHPSTRLRKLDSVRRNHVRCYDEDTLMAQRAPITDVIESGVKQLIKISTASGRSLRCSVDHAILTPEGWAKAGELAVGDAVMVAATAPRPSERLVPPSLRRGIGVWTSMQRERLIADTDRCHLCGEVYPREALALDHVVPVAENLRAALDETNLAPACQDCHTRKSATEQKLARRGGKIAVAKPDPIVSVAPDAEEMTYDLSVEGPWHNFLANGVVVHNSYNEESGRYRELEPVFYIPGEDRKLVQRGRPGKYEFVDGTPEQHAALGKTMEDSYRQSYAAYRELLADGVAREVARATLPVGLFSTMYATCNARSLMHFLGLRTQHEQATVPSFPQREIEMVAEKMETEWARLMPLTYAAFNANGRVAP
ncbi:MULTISPECIES: FAD-dependent thymidylate synthase [Streptomyces]|uniref:FAD-dependent thymidylate synthase n=2 Tax=Streptomyces TaxID=1883 RepID=UPI00190494EA|nr:MULTISPECIES: FAD-dependent thymidylate synthase [unclassified Streptomyces]QQN76890.1 FAD-dependent thymidylate synthase [Streptomyces sp. XC 2026]